MDSKSISRKGVGVRLPSLAPPSEAALAAAAHALGRTLVPYLCRRLRAATDELADLERRLARAPERALADETLARRHEELSDELARAGYCLGVLGAGGRADLLRDRREPRGLRWLAAESAAAHGARLEPGAAELPELAGPSGQNWRTALVAGWCVAAAARRAPAVRWSLRATALVLELPGPAEELLRREAHALGLRTERRALVLELS